MGRKVSSEMGDRCCQFRVVSSVDPIVVLVNFQRDYSTTYNSGRGGQFWRFRNYMIRTIGFPNPEAEIGPDEPLIVLFSANSSEKPHRAMSFVLEKNALEKSLLENSEILGLPPVIVQSYQFSKYTVKQQIEMSSKAAVFVTTCGGGAVTATFLPRGASLLVIYPEKGGVENNKWSGKPARLDWDYFVSCRGVMRLFENLAMWPLSPMILLHRTIWGTCVSAGYPNRHHFLDSLETQRAP
jgi:hypothetical protein